jgi:hypothetical protein
VCRTLYFSVVPAWLVEDPKVSKRYGSSSWPPPPPSVMAAAELAAAAAVAAGAGPGANEPPAVAPPNAAAPETSLKPTVVKECKSHATELYGAGPKAEQFCAGALALWAPIAPFPAAPVTRPAEIDAERVVIKGLGKEPVSAGAWPAVVAVAVATAVTLLLAEDKPVAPAVTVAVAEAEAESSIRSNASPSVGGQKAGSDAGELD